MKFKLNYFAPTPILFRKIGDSLLAAGTTGATFAYSNENHTIAAILMIISVIGKFMTNMVSCVENTNTENNDTK